MPIITRIALYAWPLVVLALFSAMPKRRALIMGVILGTLFLPEVQLSPVSLQAPDPNSFVLLILKFTKPNTVAFSALLAAILFDSERLLRFRPRWFDLPMLVWCVTPFISDLNNDVRPYDAFAAMRDQVLKWGVLYYLGRVYGGDPAGFRELVRGLLLGGLIYIPFCLLEVRLFPFLHERLYGFFPGARNEVYRFGGYRPIVFMTHGLMTALWMVAVAVFAFWMWWTRAVDKVEPGGSLPALPIRWVALALVGMAFLTRSTGALLLGILGVASLVQLRWFRFPVVYLIFLAVSPTFMYTRIAEVWTGKGVVELVKEYLGEERAGSLAYRLDNEDVLIPHAMNKPFFGWGDTGLNRKTKLSGYDPPKGYDEAVTDGFWVIALGCYGVVGLFSLWAAMLLPPLRLLWHYPARQWDNPAVAPLVAGCVVLIIYMIDNLPNGMYNPVFTLLAGSLAGVIGTPVRDLAAGMGVPGHVPEKPPEKAPRPTPRPDRIVGRSPRVTGRPPREPAREPEPRPAPAPRPAPPETGRPPPGIRPRPRPR